MSYRNVLSQGNVPFLWEDTPGVSKFTHQEFSAELAPNYHSNNSCKLISAQPEIKIPLPPCPVQRTTRRSSLAKGIGKQEDPFIVALRECAKRSDGNGKEDGSKNTLPRFRIRKIKFGFSCKSTCEVKDDNLVRQTNLPPLPRHKSSRGFVKMEDIILD